MSIPSSELESSSVSGSDSTEYSYEPSGHFRLGMRLPLAHFVANRSVHKQFAENLRTIINIESDTVSYNNKK